MVALFIRFLSIALLNLAVYSDRFSGNAVKYQDSGSRQIYLALNSTLYPISNPDTMDELGLTLVAIE